MCDIADKATLEDFARTVTRKYGKVDVLVNNAPPGFRGIGECTYEQFQRSMAIGVTARFYLSKLFAPYFAEGASIINISSSRDRMSQSMRKPEIGSVMRTSQPRGLFFT